MSEKTLEAQSPDGDVRGRPDRLDECITAAIAAVDEAEQIAYAACMRRTVGKHLIAAHSFLLAARNAR